MSDPGTQGGLPAIHRILDGVPHAVIVADRRGVITCANTRVARLLRLESDTPSEGRALWEILPAGLREEVSAMQREALIYATDVRREVTLEQEMGRGRLLEVSLSGVSGSAGGQPESFVITFSEAAVLQQLADLQRADQLKTNFMAVISHELRTPLTSIRGAVHLLMEKMRGNTDSAGTLTGIIQTNCDRLIRLVNNLLDMVTLDNDTFVLQPRNENLSRIVHEAAEKFEPVARARFITFKIRVEEGWGMIDPDRLNQALSHLLDNAIKFTPPGGEVTLDASWQSNGRFRVLVGDTGTGIPAHAREMIFSRFYQVQDPMTRCSGGAGVGLYLAKSIIERHGGRLWMEPNAAGGSNFMIELPGAQSGVLPAAG